MENILVHGLGQDDKSWDMIKEYLNDDNLKELAKAISEFWNK